METKEKRSESYAQKYYKKHREEFLEYFRKYREGHREYFKEQSKWQYENKIKPSLAKSSTKQGRK